MVKTDFSFPVRLSHNVQCGDDEQYADDNCDEAVQGTEPIRVFPSQPCGDALSAQDRYREHREPDPQHSSPYFANSIHPSTRHKSLDLKANKSTLMRDKRQIKIHSELLAARDGPEKVYFPKLEGTLSFDNERFWRF